MAWRESGPVEIEYPNRDKAENKLTRVIVFGLIVASAALLLIVTIGGWAVQSQWKYVSLITVAIYALMAFYVLRWKGGVLPVTAAIALIFAIFGVIALPDWANRTNVGYASTSIGASLLGTLTLISVVVQALLVVAAMRGFLQSWNVEVEHALDEHGNRIRGRSSVATA